MSYTANWQSSNENLPGKNPITIEDKIIKSDVTSITLMGKNFPNYGEIQQENFLKLLENFASKNEPSNPTIGMLWYDTKDRIASGVNAGKTSGQLAQLKICSYVSQSGMGTSNAIWDVIELNNKPVSFYSQDIEPTNEYVQVDGVSVKEILIKTGDMWYSPTSNVFRLCISITNDGTGVWKTLSNWKAGTTLPSTQSFNNDVSTSPELGELFLQTFESSLPILWVYDNKNSNGWTKILTQFNLSFFKGSEQQLKELDTVVAPGFIWYDTDILGVKVCIKNLDSEYRFNSSTLISDIEWTRASQPVYISSTEPSNTQKSNGVIWLDQSDTSTNTPLGIVKIYLNNAWHIVGKPSDDTPLANIKNETGVAGDDLYYSRADHQHPSPKFKDLLDYSGSNTPNDKDIIRYDLESTSWKNTSLNNFLSETKQWLQANFALKDLSDVNDTYPQPAGMFGGNQGKAYLYYNETSNTWEGKRLALTDIANVSLSNVEGLNVLSYSEPASEWTNTPFREILDYYISGDGILHAADVINSPQSVIKIGKVQIITGRLDIGDFRGGNDTYTIYNNVQSYDGNGAPIYGSTPIGFGSKSDFYSYFISFSNEFLITPFVTLQVVYTGKFADENTANNHTINNTSYLPFAGVDTTNITTTLLQEGFNSIPSEYNNKFGFRFSAQDQGASDNFQNFAIIWTAIGISN